MTEIPAVPFLKCTQLATVCNPLRATSAGSGFTVSRWDTSGSDGASTNVHGLGQPGVDRVQRCRAAMHGLGHRPTTWYGPADREGGAIPDLLDWDSAAQTPGQKSPRRPLRVRDQASSSPSSSASSSPSGASESRVGPPNGAPTTDEGAVAFRSTCSAGGGPVRSKIGSAPGGSSPRPRDRHRGG